MDLSKLKTHDWMMIGGSLGVLIFGLFGWSESILGETASAFDFTLTGTIPWLLIVASGVISLLLALGTINKDSAPWPLILLATFAIGALLIVIRLLIGPRFDTGFGEVTLSRGYGLYISAAAAVVAAAGAFMNFQAAGGELSDLTNMEKLKSSMSGDDGDSAPPPPPPPPPPAPDA